MWSGLCYDFPTETKIELAKYEHEVSTKPLHSQFTLFRTYLRRIYDASGAFVRMETRFEMITRVVRGTFSLVKERLQELRKWEEYESYFNDMAKRMFIAMFEDKITPPGRGLWVMGTELVNKDRVGLSLFNCSFITTENIATVKEEIFAFVMDVLMLGVGVGFDDRGAGKIRVYQPVRANYQNHTTQNHIIDQLNTFISMSESSKNKFADENGTNYIRHELEYANNIIDIHANNFNIHVIQDSREGWCDALRALINSYFSKGEYITLFDFSKVRPAGQPLKKFGGNSSGPLPLAELLSVTRYLLQQYINRDIDSLLIIDICNNIARCVIAGNVRRSSQICLSTKPEIIKAKSWSDPEYAYRNPWKWASNNSVIVEEPLTRKKVREILPTVYENGEPGLFFVNNAKNYGRMIDPINYLDSDADGTNPCGEITLRGTTLRASKVKYSAGGETCNLVETFPCNYDDINDWYSDLEVAVLYAKIVTTIPIHWKGTQDIQDAHRRIGVSQSGIALHLARINNDLELFKQICDTGYKAVCAADEKISGILNLPQSIKKTTIKPSGTVSLNANVPAGMHFPYGTYYIRRIRFSMESEEIYEMLINSGVDVEADVVSPNTWVAAFPVKFAFDVKSRFENTVEFQFELLHILQNWWADNQVSCTITFKDSEKHKLEDLIMKYQSSLKGLSLMPLRDPKYAQLPNEAITEEQYNIMAAKLKPLIFRNDIGTDKPETEVDIYCDGDNCEYVPKKKK